MNYRNFKKIRIGIMEKVFGIFLLVTFIPLFILLAINRFSASKQTLIRSAASYENVFNQTVNYLQDKTTTVKSILDMIASDTSIQDLSIIEDVLSSYTTGNWLMYDYSSHEIIFKSYLNKNISRIFLYLDQNDFKYYDLEIYKNLNEQSKEYFVEWLENSKSSKIWFNPQNMQDPGKSYTYIYCISKIPSSKVLNKNLGFLQADIPISAIKTILSGATVTQNTHVLLINEDNEEFVSNSDTKLEKEVVSEAVELLEAAGKNKSLTSIVMGENKYLAGIKHIENTGWRLLLLIPHDDILKVTMETDQIIMLTMIIIILCMIPAFFFAAQLMTKRIRELNNKLIIASGGDYSVRMEPGTNDEIGQLVENFNYLMDRTIKMMDEQYKMGKVLKNAEMQVLQEQINPHFLYNTLELLHWMALRSQNYDIDNIVLRLSQFYKLSLGEGEEIVSVAHELMHAGAYVDIQNIRFDNCIKFVIDVPEELRSYSIVKIVLQPLIENSIQHGIRKKEDKTGIITVKCREDGNELVFTIADNGIGMPESTLKCILSRKSTKGYGVYNVNERLVMYYGERSKLEYSSFMGKGTTVTFRIPKIPFQSEILS